MRFSVLASGSSGNAIFVESDRTRLLVDAGLSGKELTRRLQSIGVDPGGLDGIVVSH
ncbi:MAG: MBL fold metallo-hydrolase, partial [bacterium]|nr:MBL fold metallo-hydrolase [bacterium]